jgi:DNA-nicking Smr family endonuclease
MDDDQLIHLAQISGDAPVLDLHGMYLQEAEYATDHFLNTMFVQGEGIVRIVYGKGGEVLAGRIPEFVKKHKLVRYSRSSPGSFDTGAALYALLDV